ncbi:hypothetical protein [Anabaena azotica]|uniref:hypothetical protein n=1 Tax=Anabaena azotica TaxID=197653 RepID=UPI0039A49ECB
MTHKWAFLVEINCYTYQFLVAIKKHKKVFTSDVCNWQSLGAEILNLFCAQVQSLEYGRLEQQARLPGVPNDKMSKILRGCLVAEVADKIDYLLSLNTVKLPPALDEVFHVHD